MKCPNCGSLDKDHVLDSRPVDDGSSIKRRRECSACGKRFTTYEVVDSVPITVIKKDGSREFFDKRKLESGLIRACQKRPVETQAIANEIERELTNSLASEITTKEIGEMVMKKLREVDDVSYVRFASVYREFKDVDTFLDELQKMIELRRKEG